MRLILKSFAFLFLVFCFGIDSNAQNTRSIGDTTTYDVIIKNDGTEFVGKIIRSDAREVLINTTKLGDVVIPKHEIKEIKKISQKDLDDNGNYLGESVFATRYFLTTNGLPIKKGEHYVQWNLFGPDIQWGISDNFGLGIMTSWVGLPIIGTAKYAIPVSDKVNLGLGALLGTGSWVKPDFLVGLPFGALTIGDRRKNVNFSAGYGFVSYDGNTEGRTLMSLGAFTTIGPKMNLVFDSVIIPSTSESQAVAFFTPGLRFQSTPKKAFQFGLTAIIADGEFAPVPIPTVQWYRTLN